MRNRTTSSCVVAIAVLVIILGVEWGFLISTLSSDNYTQSNSGQPSQMQGGSSSSASYSSAKEITSDEEITSGEYASSTADENAISASGNIKAALSNITVTKTGDSDGGDNTSFYGTNSAIIAKSGANLTIKMPLLRLTPTVRTASLATAAPPRPTIHPRTTLRLIFPTPLLLPKRITLVVS